MNGAVESHKQCLTVFSASCHLGSTNFGAVLKVSPSSSWIETYSYRTVGTFDLHFKSGNILINEFKKLIQRDSVRLLSIFKHFDVDDVEEVLIN
jgi:hypothetical protein